MRLHDGFSRLYGVNNLSAKAYSTALIVGVLAGSLILGMLSYQFSDPTTIESSGWLLAVVAAIGAVIFVILALKSMPIALTLLLMVSPLINISIPTGTGSPVNATMMIVAALAGVWFLRMFVLDRRLRLVPSPLNVPVLLFLAVALISWLGGYAIAGAEAFLPSNALQVQVGQFAMFALSFVAFLLAANHKIDERAIKWWTWIIIVLGALGIITDFLAIAPDPLPAIAGALLMWPIALTMGHVLFNPDLKNGTRVLGWSFLGLWAYWAFLTPVFAWKGAWVPAFLAVIFLIALRSKVLFAGLAIAVSGAAIATGAIQSMVASEIATGTLYRPWIWLDIARMTSRSWVLGLGPANYMYYWQELGRESRTLQEALIRNPMMSPYWGKYIVVPSHNMYVDIFAQYGAVGLLVFIGFAIAALLFGWRLWRNLPPSFRHAHVSGVLCGFAAMLIGSFLFADWLIPFVYNITIGGFKHSVYSWLLLGSLVSIYRATKSLDIGFDDEA